MSHRFCLCLALLAAALSVQRCSAQGVIWNEATNGDLSNNQGAPNQFTLGVGTSSIIGSVTNTGDVQDFFTLTVPNGQVLSSAILFSYASADAIAFIGVQAGTSFVGPLNDPANFLGYAHFGIATLGADHLPAMGTASGAQGFIPPLPAGSYTFFTQQTGTSLTSYQWNFVSAVPEPTTLVLIPTAVAALLVWRWRSRRNAVAA